LAQRKAKSPPAAPPLVRIRAASEHLAYEVQALRRTRDHLATLAQPPRTEEERREVNVYTESFTVHARGLTDFLYPPRSARESDVFAWHYCPDWPTIGGTIPKILEEARERVGREIVHLTYGRLDITPAKKRWFLAHVSKPIEAALVRLVRHADPARMTPHAMAVLLGKIY
jgi:hypothetical protein